MLVSSGSMKTRLLSEEDIALEGPFFWADGVPLRSLVARYQGIWKMAVAPTEATGKMPDPNLLEITDRKWTLVYRDETGTEWVRATANYERRPNAGDGAPWNRRSPKRLGRLAPGLLRFQRSQKNRATIMVAMVALQEVDQMKPERMRPSYVDDWCNPVVS
jgi:hypothetical protein